VEAARKRDRSPGNGDMYLRLFGKPERLLTCECERSDETTMSQAFQLISGPAINEWLLQENNRLDQLLASGDNPEAMIGELYWTALSRDPAPPEARRALELLESAPSLRIGLEDLAWALMNAKEFILRH
jgi:hypothetical protein